jgi:5,10-methylenetetrahydrofolate reductase
MPRKPALPSPAQIMNLIRLCELAGEPIPHLETRADARREIHRLLEQVRRPVS